MQFIEIADVDLILGDTWTTTDKKAKSVLQANTWLSTKKFCSGLDPINDAIKQAGALLAQMASNDMLYIARTDGIVAEKSVKADTVAVSKKYVVGSESGSSSDMLFVNDLLKPFLCGGGFSINTWVCK